MPTIDELKQSKRMSDQWDLLVSLISKAKKFKSINKIGMTTPVWMTMHSSTNILLGGINESLEDCQSVQEIEVGQYDDLFFLSEKEMNDYIKLEYDEQIKYSEEYRNKYG